MLLKFENPLLGVINGGNGAGLAKVQHHHR